MSGQAPWLPEALEPVALRLARADEATFRIAELAMAWSRGGPLDLKEVDLEGGRVNLVLNRVRPIPPLLPMLFSEAINHLRSSIENVLFHLVEMRRGSQLADRQARRVAMPIHDESAKFQKWLDENVKQGVPELGPGSDLSRRLESLQPFKDSTAIPSLSPEMASMMGVQPDEQAPLTLLQGYSNQDKHRMILMGVARTSIQTSIEPFATADKRMLPIEQGQILATAVRGQPIEVETNTGVHVERPGGTSWVGPVRELDHIHKHVSQVVIPTLITGVAISPGLPPEINLLDSGLTDRERIDAGGWIAAHERSVAANLPALFDAIFASPTVIATRDQTVAEADAPQERRPE